MHCPQCGRPTPEGAPACPSCGAALAPGDVAPQRGTAAHKDVAQTMIGGASIDAPRSDPSLAARTLVGMPAASAGGHYADAARPAAAARAPQDGGARPQDRGARPLTGTMVSGTPMAKAAVAPPAAKAAKGAVASLPAGTPLRRETPQDEPRYEPAGELGATIGPKQAPWLAAQPAQPKPLRVRRVHRPVPLPQRAAVKPEPSSRRALALFVGAGVLAVAAVLFVVLRPGAPEMTARARTDASGREALELRCEVCPDGTVVSVGEGRATMNGGMAQIPLAAPLAIGENRMKVSVDRPGDGRDETMSVVASVAYRIRPDLGTLQAERPSIQIVVEAMSGTEVSIDGKSLPVAGGRASVSIDVTEAVTGFADETRMLNRQIPYAVTPGEGAHEQGVVSVSIGIVPLRIEAPGPSVVIEKESFVLEGRTAKGAQIFAGPHPIPVRADGGFAHVMNVSSIGATQFEVRAKMEGMAPRLAKIAVRRVDRLETAARDFVAQKPIGWVEIAGGSKDRIGKPIVLTGEVIEAREQGHSTVMILSIPAASGCKAAGAGGCKVRLVQGVQGAAKPGETLTAYGRVAPPGAEGAEVQVEFAIKAKGPP